VFPILIIFGFLTTCGIFIVTVIKDREDKLRYLLNFAGMRPFSYYFGLIITEYMLFLVIAFLLIIVSFLLGIDQFTNNLPQAILSLSLFGFGMINFLYMLNFFFSKSE
jgi:hypothetical protein